MNRTFSFLFCITFLWLTFSVQNANCQNTTASSNSTSNTTTAPPSDGSCASLRTCDVCAVSSHSECVWCQTDGVCIDGGFGGPDSGSCTEWYWVQCSVAGSSAGSAMYAIIVVICALVPLICIVCCITICYLYCKCDCCKRKEKDIPIDEILPKVENQPIAPPKTTTVQPQRTSMQSQPSQASMQSRQSQQQLVQQQQSMQPQMRASQMPSNQSFTQTPNQYNQSVPASFTTTPNQYNQSVPASFTTTPNQFNQRASQMPSNPSFTQTPNQFQRVGQQGGSGVFLPQQNQAAEYNVPIAAQQYSPQSSNQSLIAPSDYGSMPQQNNPNQEYGSMPTIMGAGNQNYGSIPGLVPQQQASSSQQFVPMSSPPEPSSEYGSMPNSPQNSAGFLPSPPAPQKQSFQENQYGTTDNYGRSIVQQGSNSSLQNSSDNVYGRPQLMPAANPTDNYGRPVQMMQAEPFRQESNYGQMPRAVSQLSYQQQQPTDFAPPPPMMDDMPPPPPPPEDDDVPPLPASSEYGSMPRLN